MRELRVPVRPKKNRRKRKPVGPDVRRLLWRGLRLSVSAVVAFVALAGAFMGVYYGWQALLCTDRLAVRTIRVVGAEHTTDAEVVAYAGVSEGAPILGLDLDAIALRLRRHPWVQWTSVRRRLPDSVTLEVREHQPALIVSLGDLYIANAQGRVFKRLRAADRVALPVLTGLSGEDAASRASMTAERIRDAIALGASLQAAEHRYGRLEELHWDCDLGWSVGLLDAGGLPVTRVHLGDDLAAALPVADSALTLLRGLGKRPHVVWADGRTRSELVAVQLASSGTEGDVRDLGMAVPQARPETMGVGLAYLGDAAAR